MSRTRRSTVDELAGYDSLGLDSPTLPQDDYYQVTPGITVWGTGLVTFGAPTAAQIEFMANLATNTDLSTFPGDCIAIGFSTAQHAVIEYWTGGVWLRTPTADVAITDDGFSVRGSAIGDQQVGWHIGNNAFQPSTGTATVFWSDFNVITGQYPGADQNLVGTAGAETLVGGNGDDVLSGGGGSDALDGGGGNDHLIGGAGNDRLWGGDGDDILDPGAAGSQYFRLGFGLLDPQPVDGGAGFDTLVLDFTASGDSQSIAAAQYMLDNGVTDVEAVDITGSQFIDDITGTANNDRLAGGDGYDVLRGGSGNDVLDAGPAGPSSFGGLAEPFRHSDVSIDHLFTAGPGGATLSLEVFAPCNFLQNTGLQRGGSVSYAFTVTQAGAQMFIDYDLPDMENEDFHFGIVDAEGVEVTRPNYDPAVPFVFPHAGTYYLTALVVDRNQWDSARLTLDLTFDNADVLTGNRLFGGTGNDSYIINAASDLVVELAGEGSDTVYSSIDYWLGAEVEHLTLRGTAVNGIGNSAANTITGNGANNFINGGMGNDVLRGAGGSDSIVGDWGNDTLDGGAGDDLLDGGGGVDLASYATATAAVRVNLGVIGAAQDTLGAGVDTLTAIENAIGSNFADTLIGNTGANSLNGINGDDLIYGGAGNDSLVGGEGSDTLDGGVGNDALNGGNGIDTASYAAAGAAVTINLGVAAAQNTLGAGFETLTGIENAAGSAFNDTLIGNTGANSLTGNGGNDIVYGGAGNDSLNGGEGNDTLDGGIGNDTLNGGNGVDLATYGSATTRVVVSLTATGAQNTLGAGLDTLTGVENLTGSAFNDTLVGSAGANTINGGNGNDLLYGRAGNDILIGGAGQDNFRFDTALNATTNVDTLSGFVAADDTVLLSTAIFIALGAGTLSAAAFQAGTAANDAGDRIIYDSATGRIFYDADGGGAAAQILFARVAVGTALSNLDFVGQASSGEAVKTAPLPAGPELWRAQLAAEAFGFVPGGDAGRYSPLDYLFA